MLMFLKIYYVKVLQYQEIYDIINLLKEVVEGMNSEYEILHQKDLDYIKNFRLLDDDFMV